MSKIETIVDGVSLGTKLVGENETVTINIKESGDLEVTIGVKEEPIPIARIAKLTCNLVQHRLIFRVTRKMAEDIDKYIAIDLQDGRITNHWYPENDKYNLENYTDVKTLS